MKRVAIISGTSDGTAHYFSKFLKNEVCEARHYYWENFASSPAEAVGDLLEYIGTKSGLYVREPARFDLYDYALRDAIFACLPDSTNLIAPSRKSTNWSKLLHERELAHFLSNGCNSLKVPKSEAVSCSSFSTILSGSFIQKNISSTPGSPSRVARDYRSDKIINPLDGYMPTLIQAELSGNEYRIHVIDSEAIAFRIIRHGNTTAIDDPAPCPCEPAILPRDILSCCVAITQREGLRFSGVDVIEDTCGKFWLLEVNPMPGYHAYESRLQHSDKPISRNLYRALTNDKK